MLNLPIPTVSEVVFRVTLFRRASDQNSYDVLGTSGGNRKRADSADQRAPSKSLLCENYAIALPRLSDFGDLKLRLQNLSGIKRRRLQMVEGVTSSKVSE